VIEFLTVNGLWVLLVLAMHRYGGCGGHTHGHASDDNSGEEHLGPWSRSARSTEPSHDTRSMP